MRTIVIDFLKLKQDWHLGDFQLAICAVLVIALIIFLRTPCLAKRWISAKNALLQVLGVILKSPKTLFPCFYVLLYLVLTSGFVIYRWKQGNLSSPQSITVKALIILFSIILFGITTKVTVELNKIFSLRKLETRITWCQINLLFVFGVSVAMIIFALGIKKDDDGFLLTSLVGVVLGWIFQDTIKSVAAFFYLRVNGLLQIGDLISVPSKSIEGFVRTISLTTVTIENWDTTTSAFPTYILHSEHFKNNQRMMEGKTLGRLMLKTFILDTGWIHPLTEKDVKRLQIELDAEKCFIEKEVKCGKLNIEVFRLYIYYWLTNNPYVSQQPRLIVRWLEQTDEGLPLQLFAYLTDTMLDAFEWRQSQIIEHVIKAIGWFDLQLFQSPSGYDASNSNIYLTQQSANYRKKTEDNAKLKEK